MEHPCFMGLWILPEAELWGFARQPDGDSRRWASGSLFNQPVGNQPVGDPLGPLNPVDRVHMVLLDAYPLPRLEEPGPGWKGWTWMPLLRGRSRHQLALDVAGFSAEELLVRLEGRKLTVLGHHEETEALDGCLCRETRHVRQELLLPPDADLEALTCALAHNGRLRIQAPRLQRTIPVTVETSPTEAGETDGGAEATAAGGGEKLDGEGEE